MQAYLMTGHSPSESALNLSFDIFQRYAAVAHLIRANAGGTAGGRVRVLDVGSGDASFLSGFLPEADYEIYRLDKGMSPKRVTDPHFVRGDAVSLPFPDKFFTTACCIDLLEHLSREDRDRAIDEMARVTRGPLILAAPCAEDEVVFYEEVANAAHTAYFGEGSKWLEEHRELSLPRSAELLQYCAAKHGMSGQVFPNGYLPRWREMITFNSILRKVGPLADYARLVSRFYNEKLYPYDNREPCYRRVILLGESVKGALPCRREDTDSRKSYAQLQQFLGLGYQMLGILSSSRAEARASEARGPLESVQRAVSAQEVASKRIEEELARLRAEWKQLKAGRDEALTELSRERASRERAQVETSRALQELGRTQADATLVREEQIRLQGEMEKARAEATEAREDRTRLRGQLETVQEERTRLRGQLETVQEERTRLRGQLERAQAEAVEARGETTNVRGELARSQTEAKQAGGEAISLRGELEAAQAERTQQAQQISKLRESVRRQEARISRIFASRTYRAGKAVLFPFSIARLLLKRDGAPATRSRWTKQDARIIQYTPPNPDNPFYTVTLRALQRLGWSVTYQDNPERILEQMRAESDRRFLVLFHQFDPYVRAIEGRSTRGRASELMRNMLRLKQAGASLVWTLHNALPHDADDEQIEQELRLRKFVAQRFDAVIVLNEAGRKEARRFFRDEMIDLVPHVSFKDVHGPQVAQSTARQKFGYPEDAFFFGTFGAIRPYKGLELIIDAFRGLDGEDIRLLIVGSARQQDYLDALRNRAIEDERIIIRSGRTVPSDDIPLWLAVMDVAVFGFSSVLTSGSVILALSYGRPVIAPEVGGIPEVVLPEQTGVLYEPDSVESLRDAMDSIRGHPLLHHMRYMASPSLDEVTPDKIAGHLQQVLGRILNVAVS